MSSNSDSSSNKTAKARPVEGVVVDADSNATGEFRADGSLSSPEVLLGPARPMVPRENQSVLIRLSRSLLADVLDESRDAMLDSSFERLKSETLINRQPVVMGPYKKLELMAIMDQLSLPEETEILQSHDRWRPLLFVYPELKEKIKKNPKTEVTETKTATKSNTGLDATDTNADAQEYTKTETSAPSYSTPDVQDAADSKAQSFEQAEHVELEDTTSVRPVQGSGKTSDSSFQRPRAALKSKKQSSSPSVWVGGSLVVGVLLLGAWFWRQNRVSSSAVAQREALSKQAGPQDISDWPEHLRPLPREALFANDSPLVSKVRKIMLSYQDGSLSLGLEDEKTLQRMSDPASASFEARRLATNQLALFQAAGGRLEDAQRTVDVLYAVAKADFVTAVNRGLLKWIGGKSAEALESLQRANQYVPEGLSWLAKSLQILMQSKQLGGAQVHSQFQTLFHKHSSNLLLRLLEIRALLETSNVDLPLLKKQISAMTYFSPDSLWDSPLMAPLPVHLISKELHWALDQVQEKISDLPAFERDWIKLLQNIVKTQRNDNQSWSVLSNSSAKENLTTSSSSFLNAVALLHLGSLTQSREMLDRLVTSGSLDSEQFLWSRTLLGDLYFEARVFEKAAEHYNEALKISPQFVPALHGMAMVLRERKDFYSAEEKLSEVRTQDPLFLPALLRMTRFEWRTAISHK